MSDQPDVVPQTILLPDDVPTKLPDLSSTPIILSQDQKEVQKITEIERKVLPPKLPDSLRHDTIDRSEKDEKSEKDKTEKPSLHLKTLKQQVQLPLQTQQATLSDWKLIKKQTVCGYFIQETWCDANGKIVESYIPQTKKVVDSSSSTFQ
ncbi:hypothetical protein EIN_390820 [Entamoeba invadens IP1]|uniref:Uncharacterized protein n=1 Tax=Entamoeba invadens IP1 TaxID=370355 RepID=A0A0A1U5F3_ENTIV|nr:hypothetical protein EIN_390820 [Entamoeba invadens IP1]ELP89457.1 hypothetical protein EIN_390820 [Entamoeba invadens IP1]|eukprot:XP_004256228.1 hypothetical protein EIN_390820 [Entamoeba invadens IP1]